MFEFKSRTLKKKISSYNLGKNSVFKISFSQFETGLTEFFSVLMGYKTHLNITFPLGN